MSFVELASATGNGTSDLITFSNIPQTYKDLMIIGTLSLGFNAGYTTFSVLANNDTGSNYNWLKTFYNGAASSNTQFGANAWRIEIIGTTPTAETSPVVMCFQDYANTTKNKTMYWRANTISQSQSFYRMETGWGNRNSTAAITTLTLRNSSGVSWPTLTNVRLYGLAGN